MKILYNWLKEFVDFTATPEELRSRLAMSGTQVDAIEDSPEGPVLDVELFMNRPDCMGHYGIAREVAALCRTRLKPVRPQLSEARDRAADATRVDIECPELCGRFTARVIRGVKVQPSPDWLRRRLEALGAQSINNVVDATNYVMFELGHPLHAFDLDTLAERRIVVRRARKGEKFRTLDGVERTLDADVCMVGDAARHTGIGGIMGGAETEISFSTKNVLLECAWFDPVSIRRSAKALGLRTEASTRFERGMDPEMAELASRRCAALIHELAGGEVLAGVVDVYPGKAPPATLELTRRELLRVMGADVPDAEVEAILTALGFAPRRTDGHQSSRNSLVAAWECRRVSWRHDVTREIDLVEEVARHFGYDKFPARLPVARQPAARLLHAAADDALRDLLVALGYHEIVSIPLVDAAADARFRPAGAAELRIANPLAEDAAVLRTSGLPGVLRALEWNLNRGQRSVRLFEIGRAYSARGAETAETPVLTLAATGMAREKSVHEEGREFSFADLKGALEALGALAGGITWQGGGPEWLHPARAARLFRGGEEIGCGGQLARRTAEQLKLRQEVYLAELRLEPLRDGYAAARAAVRARPLPRFPAVERDFSLLVDEGTTFAQVEGCIRGLGIAAVERIAAADLYRGKGVPAGKYSLLVRVVFQSHQATLTDAQVNGFAARIVAALEQQLGAALRTA